MSELAKNRFEGLDESFLKACRVLIKWTGIEHRRLEYSSMHDVRDHAVGVAEYALKLAEWQGINDKNELMAYFLGALWHDMVQPHKTKNNDFSLMIKKWSFDKNGSEEAESAKFVGWYLQQGNIKKMLKRFDVQFDTELIK